MKTGLIFILLLFLSGITFAFEGDVRVRLQRRFPSCRGTIENYYAGDEFGFYDRFRFRSGTMRFSLLLDKARGEEWVDIVSGGVMWTPPNSNLQSVSAGWLKADLGSGMVLSCPGSWSDLNELALYKPPGIRNRIEPATSAWGCRGNPLIGASAIARFGDLDVSFLAAYSVLDSIGDGHHRTPSEIAGKAAIREILGAVRAGGEKWGITLAGATELDCDERYWIRMGTDWDLDFSTFTFTGETAAGADSGGVSVAFWAAPSQNFGHFRHMLMLLRNPSDFPDARTSPPIGRECDIGFCYGLRWNVFPRTALKAGAGTYFNNDEHLLRGSALIQYRFPWNMEATAGVRTATETAESSWRAWAGNNWQPLDKFNIRTKLSFTGWSSDEDSTENGTGIELKIRYSPISLLSLGLGGAAFATDGYNSRVYAAEPFFPGEFGSTALWDRGFMFHMSVSAEITEDLFLRARFLRKIIENVTVLGSGWEETEGDSRTEFGFQLDCAFH